MLSPILLCMISFTCIFFSFFFFLIFSSIHLYEVNFLNDIQIHICRKGYGWNYMKNVNLVGMKYLLKCFQLFFFWVQACAIGPTFLEFNWNTFGLNKLNISYQNINQNWMKLR
jgi:hypothetical protein